MLLSLIGSRWGITEEQHVILRRRVMKLHWSTFRLLKTERNMRLWEQGVYLLMTERVEHFSEFSINRMTIYLKLQRDRYNNKNETVPVFLELVFSVNHLIWLLHQLHLNYGHKSSIREPKNPPASKKTIRIVLRGSEPQINLPENWGGKTANEQKKKCRGTIGKEMSYSRTELENQYACLCAARPVSKRGMCDVQLLGVKVDRWERRHSTQGTTRGDDRVGRHPGSVSCLSGLKRVEQTTRTNRINPAAAVRRVQPAGLNPAEHNTYYYRA